MSLILSIIALALSSMAFALLIIGRVFRGKPPTWWSPNEVRAIESCNRGDVVILTTDQHLTKAQVEALGEWSQAFRREHGLEFVVIGGLKPEMVLRNADATGHVGLRVSPAELGEAVAKCSEDAIRDAELRGRLPCRPPSSAPTR